MYTQRRLERERKTLEAMLQIYCRSEHDTYKGLCPDCQQLYDYALLRLEKCPYQEAKPTCAKCPIHCYKPDMRERMRRVMRNAGPRMLVYHPMLSILHVLDGMAKAPQKKSGR